MVAGRSRRKLSRRDSLPSPLSLQWLGREATCRERLALVLTLSESGGSGLLGGGRWGIVGEKIKEILGSVTGSVIQYFLLSSTEFLSKRRWNQTVGQTCRQVFAGELVVD